MTCRSDLIASASRDEAAARANRSGEPCPPWCTVDHGKVLAVTPSGRELYADAHLSDPMGGGWPAPAVMVRKIDPETPPEVSTHVLGSRPLTLDPGQAEALASMLGALRPGDVALLAERLRAAAAIARDTDAPQGGAR